MRRVRIAPEEAEGNRAFKQILILITERSKVNRENILPTKIN